MASPGAAGSTAGSSPRLAEVRAVAADPLVIFTPPARRARFPEDTTFLDAARSVVGDIDSVCGGRRICGRCQVEPSFGTFPKHGITASPDHLSPPGEQEAAYERLKAPLGADRRL